MRLLTLGNAVALLVLGGFFAGCSSIETAHGTSGKYSSFRLVHSEAELDANNEKVRDSIVQTFESNGLTQAGTDAELVVAYLIIRQDHAATQMERTYFGRGRDANEILKEAHKRGVIKKSGTHDLDVGAILIDVLDTETDKLVYREFAKRDLLPELSQEDRNALIEAAVAEALSAFFR